MMLEKHVIFVSHAADSLKDLYDVSPKLPLSFPPQWGRRKLTSHFINSLT